jgi:hypothetical protein
MLFGAPLTSGRQSSLGQLSLGQLLKEVESRFVFLVLLVAEVGTLLSFNN